jgi:aldehyde dehydrogenase (NAD+)
MASTISERAWTGISGGRQLKGTERHRDIDPGTGQVIAEVTLGSAEDVHEAVDLAHAAFVRSWRLTDPSKRADLLRRMAQAITEASDELARLESLDTGKPLREAKADVWVAARYFQFYANTIEALGGETIVSRADLFAYTLRQPIGVTAHITPWNYPLQIGARSIAPSLAAGNCVVLKPSTEAPLSSIRLAELAAQVGFPDGVVNVIPGRGQEAGMALAQCEGVGKVSFTGSVEVGRTVARAAAENVTPVTLELGGKSANVVFADADLQRAVPVIANSILQHCGQSCVAGSRLLVEETVATQLLDALEKRFQSIRLGHGLDDPDMGPLISERQRDQVKRYVEGAGKTGRLVIGGSAPEDPALQRGFFFLPTIFADVDPTSALAQDEVFGPVLAVTTFESQEEALELANSTRYGLAGAVWTKDVGRAHAVAHAIQAGTVHINGFGVGGGVEMPSGGFKQSGYGREKGFEAVLEFTQLKSVHVRP